MHDERQVLMHDFNAELGGALGAARAKRLARRRRSRLRQKRSSPNAANERRLSRAIVPDEPHHLAGPDREVDVFESVQASECLTKAGDAKKRLCRPGHALHSAGWR